MGGDPYWFISQLLEPHLDRSFTIYSFSFLTNGSYAAEYTNIYHVNPWAFRTRMLPIDAEVRPVDDILRNYHLPDLNLADMPRMEYGFRTQMTVNPRAHFPRLCYEPTFPGQIWLLTGPYMSDMLQLSVWVARETGFATLVGETTGGNWGAPITFVTLPNSGIAFQLGLFYVTDSRGWPLDAGIVPDIFNMDGKCALETVLYVISTQDR